MLATRVIHSFACRSFRQYLAKPSLSQTCLSPSPATYRLLSIPRPAQGASPAAPTHRTDIDSAKEGNPVNASESTSSAAANTNLVENPSSDPQNTTLNKQSIPDVPSTSWSSIGFDEDDAKDPNKWKKFAWKYAGAVLLFMVSYKTLHWYTDRLEADGKRKRKEMEEDREIAQQIRNSHPQAERFPFLEPLKDAPKLPETSSELDELYAYKAQLESNLQTLRSQGRSSEIRAQTKEAESEIKELADDIRLLEIKKAAS